ncbi:MAG TPA: sensor histidine kinase, partial [Chthoniobacteraceae bacterium]
SVSGETLPTAASDAQWAEIQGIVRSITPENDRLLISLEAEGQRVLAVLPGYQQRQPRHGHLVGLEVELQGVVGATQQSNKVFGPNALYVPQIDCVTITPEALAFHFERPSNTYNELFPGRKRDHEEFGRVRGRVLGAIPGVGFFLSMHDPRNKGGRVWVQSSARGVLHEGDIVEVVGRKQLIDTLPSLFDALFRVVGKGEVPDGYLVRGNDLSPGAFHNDVVRIDGPLIERRKTPEEDTIVIESDGRLFSATLPLLRGELAELQRGAELRLRGVYLSRTSPEFGPVPAAFYGQMQMFRPSDVTVLANPPWWNAERTGWALKGIGGFAAVGLAWTVSLHRRNVRLRREVAARQEAEAALERERGALAERVEERTAELRFEMSARHEAEAILRERSRLASELHDTLEQGLTGVGLQLEAACNSTTRAPENTVRHLDLARTLLRQSKSEVRRSVWNLRSQMLEDHDLAGALQMMLRQVALTAGLEANLEVLGAPIRFDEVSESHLLRIAQEAITNAVKHARARKLQLTLSFSERDTLLTVSDDGQGFDSQQTWGNDTGHFGLTNMRERAARIGADFQLKTAPGGGTSIEIRRPASPAVTAPAP